MYSVRMRTSANEGDGNPKPVDRYRRPPLHSSFTVGRIDLDEDQLGSERVVLVDDRNGHMYLWFGTMSTFKHRGFGLEAATRLKADSPKGGQVWYLSCVDTWVFLGGGWAAGGGGGVVVMGSMKYRRL